ncbi:hypothetical protein JVU11DRAFT_656 [Chiua virens]|nr:hypothetical protein JVU11DRAFT_656 [Chiua virens]
MASYDARWRKQKKLASSKSRYTRSNARGAACQSTHPNIQLVTIDPITRLDSAQDARPTRQDPATRLESPTEPSQTTATSSTHRYPLLQTQASTSLVPSTRPRALVEDSEGDAPPAHPTDSARAYKRQRILSQSTSASGPAFSSPIDRIPLTQGSPPDKMYIPRSDKASAPSSSIAPISEAGPSSITLDKSTRSNGVTSINGCKANGSPPMSNGVSKHTSSVARVSLPGTTLYDDPYVDREEFVRLVIQSLRDVGYIESAATLEAESGYSLEAPEVTQFRRYILNADWANAESLLSHLTAADEEAIWEAHFLIGRQKYLELLEARKTTAALQVLRNELAPLSTNPEQLHALSSLIMCSDPEDLRRRASWDGASGTSRRTLLSELQHFIPSTTMIPSRRLAALLTQSRYYQREHCLYHNAPMNAASFSLFSDHHCDREDFPCVTTTVLDVHTDEVWNVAWSHDGLRLASASKDKTAIIWQIGSDAEPTSRECVVEFTLREHPFPVGALAWSLDDSILATSADQLILLWDTKRPCPRWCGYQMVRVSCQQVWIERYFLGFVHVTELFSMCLTCSSGHDGEAPG